MNQIHQFPNFHNFIHVFLTDLKNLIYLIQKKIIINEINKFIYINIISIKFKKIYLFIFFFDFIS